jgi:intracellular septation protein A
MPAPRTALRHAVPIVLEALLVPLAVFYVVLILAGFRGALIAALCWSLLALGRRLHRRERISMMLLLGTMLLVVRTTIAFITGSSFVYFAQPAAGTIIISLVLFGSAIMKKPFTQRFAGDFCPMDPELMKRPMVHRFFVRISVLWASVLMLNAGFILWLLVASSLHAFVLERSLVTWTLTAAAIYISIRQFIVMMRGDGITVQWAVYGQPEPHFEGAHGITT